MNISDIDEQRKEAVAAELEVEYFEKILEAIGLGNHPVFVVAQKLVQDPDKIDKKQQHPLIIAGTEGMIVSFGRCCYPIPGDPIHGFISTGRGIVIHKMDCKNTLKFRNQNEKWLDVVWASEITRDFPVEIMARINNQRGVLATISAAVSQSNANIDNVFVEERDGGYSDLRLTIEVNNRQHLARIIKRLRWMDQVKRIARVY